MTRTLGWLALTCAAVAAAAPSASALTARVDGTTVRISAIDLERNDIRIDFLSNRVVEIRELNPTGPKLFGLGLACDRVGTPAERDRRLVCNATDIRLLSGSLGPGDDRMSVTGNPIRVDVDGGLGSDNLDGGGGNDRLIGGGGPIQVVDVLSGGDGLDLLQPGAGRSRMIADGGPGNDLLVGGDEADTLLGGPGEDALGGGPGDDDLNGGPGEDLVRGEDGNDTLRGGGQGEVFGDRLHGDGGNDVFRLVDGSADTFFCGFGTDDVEAELRDFTGFLGECESLRRAPTDAHPTVRLLGRSLVVGAGIRIDLACPAALAAPCAGTLRATAVRGRRGRVLIGLGRADYTLAPGRRRTVRITLSDRARRVLAASPRLRLTSVEPGTAVGPKTASITVEVAR